MPMNPNQSGNPLKEDGQSKATTRQHADHDEASKPRKPAGKTVTGQGGSDKGGRKPADTAHRSQQGGMKPPMDEEGAKRARSIKPGRIGGEGEEQA